MFSPGGPPFSAEYVMEVSVDGENWTAVADHEGRLPYDNVRLEELLKLAVWTKDERHQYEQLNADIEKTKKALQALPPLQKAWVGNFEQPSEVTYLQEGGDPQKRGPDVAPASLDVLSEVTPGYELAMDAPEAERREALARLDNPSRQSPDSPCAGQPHLELPFWQGDSRHAE